MSVKFTSKGLADGTDSTKELEFNVTGVTTGTTRTITVPDENVDLGKMGKVLQVVQAYKSDVFTTSASVDTDITGLSVTITPTSTSSKILITSNVSGFSHNGLGGGLCIKRGSTKIGLADTSGSRTRTSFSGDLYTGDAAGTGQMHFNAVACYLDSPTTTSATIYKITAQCNGSNLYINREETNNDNNDTTLGTSHITVMEIGA